MKCPVSHCLSQFLNATSQIKPRKIEGDTSINESILHIPVFLNMFKFLIDK